MSGQDSMYEGMQHCEQEKKATIPGLQPSFWTTFRSANGGYKEVVRKPESSEVPDSRYEAKQYSEFCWNCTWMEEVLLEWVWVRLPQTVSNLPPPTAGGLSCWCPSQLERLEAFSGKQKTIPGFEPKFSSNFQVCRWQLPGSRQETGVL